MIPVVTYRTYHDNAADNRCAAAGVPMLKLISIVCGDCGDDHAQLRCATKAEAAAQPMATCPNPGHRSWRVIWGLPEPTGGIDWREYPSPHHDHEESAQL